MKVLITGATGFVGRALAEKLFMRGHDIVVVSRNPEKAKANFAFPVQIHAWDSSKEIAPAAAFEGVETVINLAGESISHRWTDEVKKAIYDSRILGTRHLVQGMQQANASVKHFLSASAIGFYGERGDEALTEKSPGADDFLAKVCRDWEAEAMKAGEGVRKVLLRIGVVLGQGGGMLEKVLTPFRLGVAGPLGSGQQWMSWIHLEDLTEAIVFLLESGSVSGPVNLVAPTPVTNAEFTKTLGGLLHRPTFFRAPALALKTVMGEMSSFILASTKVFPEKLVAAKFSFAFKDLKNALAHLVSKKRFEDQECDELIFTQWVPRRVEEIFPFFSDEKNLERITPPWLNFNVLGKNTPEIGEGTLIDYKLMMKGMPMHWQSRIEKWEPNKQFVDRQLRGPYALWHHTHLFEPLRGGTLLIDRVKYRLPAGKLGAKVAGAWVRRDIQTIFSYRKSVIEKLFY